MIPDITVSDRHQGSGDIPSRDRSTWRLSPYRAPYEFYPTPPEATRAFLKAEQFDGDIWEPACGQGAIAKECEAAGYRVTSTDLANYGYGEAGCDFLKQDVARAKHIVTNPPYGHGLADRFVRQALQLTAMTGGKVAMLLNLMSLCDPQRHHSFVVRPPARIYALDECVCYPNGDPELAGPYTRKHRYCWLVWDAISVTQPQKVTTTFHWLSTAQFAEGSVSCR